GRIVWIKSLLMLFGITTVLIDVNAAQSKLVLLEKFNENYSKCLRLLYKVKATEEVDAASEEVSTAELDECPKNIGSGVAKNLKKPSQAPRGVLVGPKVGFKLAKQVYKPVSKKPNANTSGNKKKDVEPTKEVQMRRASNLASKKANSSESLFWNVGSGSTSTTPIVEKVITERLIIDGRVTLMDDEGKPLEKKVGYGTNSLLEQWKETYESADYDYDPYNDDMYEGQEIPDKIQSVCDNLDIKVRGSDRQRQLEWEWRGRDDESGGNEDVDGDEEM
ncbi:hypothetical protein Tco_0591439, partial [Tanacetum coccineum]